MVAEAITIDADSNEEAPNSSNVAAQLKSLDGTWSSLQSDVIAVHRLPMGSYASFDHGATMSKLGVNDGAVTVSGWKLRAVDGFSAHTHRIKNATVVDVNFVTDELEENPVRQHGSKKDGRKLRAQCADLTSPCMEANEWL